MDALHLVAVGDGLVDVGLNKHFIVRFTFRPLHLSNGNLLLVFLLVFPKLGALQVRLDLQMYLCYWCKSVVLIVGV